MLKPRNYASCFAGSDSKTLIISITATTVLLAVSVLLLSLTGHSLQRVQLVASLRSECAGLEASDPLVVWDATAAMLTRRVRRRLAAGGCGPGRPGACVAALRSETVRLTQRRHGHACAASGWCCSATAPWRKRRTISPSS